MFGIRLLKIILSSLCRNGKKKNLIRGIKLIKLENKIFMIGNPFMKK